MAAAVALAVYAAFLAVAVTAVWRRPVVALYAFIVGLALHNVVMATLYGAGVRGASLTAIQAWKEVLLGVALARVIRDPPSARRLRIRPSLVDLLALAFAAVVVVYAVIPQDALGGEADARSVVYGLRHALVPVTAFFLGRTLALTSAAVARLCWTVVATAAAVAVFGIVEVYAVSLDYWRESGAAGWFRDQLGFEYRGLSGLPENFVFNTGDEDDVLRRLVSTFLSPLATAFMLVVALLVLAARERVAQLLLFGPLLAVALFLTHTRAAILTLAGALVVLAVVRRRGWPVAAAAATIAIGGGFVLAYPHIAPETRFTAEELEIQRANARGEDDTEHGGLDTSEPSLRSHFSNLRDGAERVVDHPQGYGLGNSGSTAARFGGDVKAGESTYTELGVEVGVAGLALFVAWMLALFASLVRRARGDGDSWTAAGIAASLAAVLALGLQTDVIGVPWLAYCVWSLAGALHRLAIPSAR